MKCTFKHLVLKIVNLSIQLYGTNSPNDDGDHGDGAQDRGDGGRGEDRVHHGDGGDYDELGHGPHLLCGQLALPGDAFVET